MIYVVIRPYKYATASDVWTTGQNFLVYPVPMYAVWIFCAIRCVRWVIGTLYYWGVVTGDNMSHHPRHTMWRDVTYLSHLNCDVTKRCANINMSRSRSLSQHTLGSSPVLKSSDSVCFNDYIMSCNSLLSSLSLLQNAHLQEHFYFQHFWNTFAYFLYTSHDSGIGTELIQHAICIFDDFAVRHCSEKNNNSVKLVLTTPTFTTGLTTTPLFFSWRVHSGVFLYQFLD